MEKHISYNNGYKNPYRAKLDAIAAAGFTGTFFIYRWDDDFDAATKYAQQIGLRVFSMHLPFYGVNAIWKEGSEGDAFVDTLTDGVRYAADSGIPNVVAHVSSSATPPPFCDLGLRRMERVIALCDQLGVKLCMENTRHNQYLDRFFAEINGAEKLGFCLDTGHTHGFTHDTTDPRWLPYFAKITCVHIHDNDGTADQHLLPFDGTLDWRYLMPAAFADKRDVPLTLEFTDNARTLHPDWDEQRFLQEAMARLVRLEAMIDGPNA